MTDRAVSVTVNYVMSLAITTLLISGLLMSTGDVVGDRRESVVRGELEVVGERISAGIETADRLARTGATEVTLEVSAPRRVGGMSYSISVDGANRVVTLETRDPDVIVEVPFRNRTNVATTTTSGGTVEVALTGGDLEVRSP